MYQRSNYYKFNWILVLIKKIDIIIILTRVKQFAKKKCKTDILFADKQIYQKFYLSISWNFQEKTRPMKRYWASITIFTKAHRNLSKFKIFFLTKLYLKCVISVLLNLRGSWMFPSALNQFWPGDVTRKLHLHIIFQNSFIPFIFVSKACHRNEGWDSYERILLLWLWNVRVIHYPSDMFL